MATLHRNLQHPIIGHVYILKGYIEEFVYDGTCFLSTYENKRIYPEPLVYNHLGHKDNPGLYFVNNRLDCIYGTMDIDSLCPK